MSDLTDLVSRLRKLSAYGCCLEAADALSRLIELERRVNEAPRYYIVERISDEPHALAVFYHPDSAQNFREGFGIAQCRLVKAMGVVEE